MQPGDGKTVPGLLKKDSGGMIMRGRMYLWCTIPPRSRTAIPRLGIPRLRRGWNHPHPPDPLPEGEGLADKDNSIRSGRFRVRRTVLLVLPLDDADPAVLFHEGTRYPRQVLDPLFSNLAHQFLFGDQFSPHVPPEHLTISDQQERSGFDDASERRETEAEPVQE